MALTPEEKKANQRAANKRFSDNARRGLKVYPVPAGDEVLELLLALRDDDGISDEEYLCDKKRLGCDMGVVLKKAAVYHFSKK
jgi:hypothetical protein